jgi:hypothetical protein
MILKFGEYLPDVPDFMNPGLTTADNVVPSGPAYTPFLSPAVYSNALTARCQGAYSAKDTGGNTANFAGDASKLYKSSAAVYSDVSLAGGYTTSAEDNWHWAQFGNIVIATNGTDYPQSFTLGTSSNFANLTTALKGKYCTVVRNFLVFGNTVDASDGAVPHRVRWSALNAPTDFTVSAVTQSDYNDLNSTHGWVRQVVGGAYGTIFQERAISRMVYSGSPTVFTFEEVEIGKGTQYPYSVLKIGNNIFYLGIDGFYLFDGSQSIPIGEGKINRTFMDDLDGSYPVRVYAAADFDKQVIYVAYPGAGNTGGRANKILCYNYAPNAITRWTTINNLDIEFIYRSLSEGYTLEDLDAFSSSIDAMTLSLDSRSWTGENFIVSGFNSSHQQVNFTGAALTALIETGEAQLTQGRITNLLRVRPLVDGAGTVTLQIGTRNNLSQSVTWGSAISTDQTGEFQIRSNARYHRARLNISGGFTNAQGLELLEFTDGGKR